MCRGWGLMGLWLCAALLSHSAQAASSPPGCAPAVLLPLQTVLPGVAVVHGHWPAVEAERPDHLATTVVLGQGAEVTVLDPGPSRRAGLALQNTLRCQQKARVTGVINSHAHAEQVLANSAFRVRVKALVGTVRSMRQRCPECLATLRQDLGAQALQGTRIMQPHATLQEGQTLHIGGRVWQVQAMLQAHTESDLVLWSPGREGGPAREGVVLAGGLVDGRWPVLAQGSVIGWLAALDRVQAMQPQWLIGQHAVAGPQQVPQVLQRQRAYLCGLLGHAWRKLEQGQSEAETVQGLALPAQWPAPDAKQAQAWRQQHMFNQLRAWREAEQMWLSEQAWPAACGSTPDIVR